jgi:hypothetical protein
MTHSAERALAPAWLRAWSTGILATPSITRRRIRIAIDPNTSALLMLLGVTVLGSARWPPAPFSPRTGRR